MQSSIYPQYHLVGQKPTNTKCQIYIYLQSESQSLPQHLKCEFIETGTSIDYQNGKKIIHVAAQQAQKLSITSDTYVHFSTKTAQLHDYFGIACDILACHKFSRKSKKSNHLKVYIPKNTILIEKILSLTQAKNQSIEQCNVRGDIQGIPSFFQQLALQFAKNNGIQVKVIKGQDLLKEGFRLMHAVGRASKNQPTFINLSYKGNPDSDSWVSFVGKGVCFDAGGLDIKSASGMKDMHLDKCGAVSIFTAFQFVVKQKIKINLTVSLGFVQNFLSNNSYRPSDIITSRKGLTIQIGNTDAQGRLVLADCMNWTQQNYKTEILIELSTLTGAIVTALGNRHSGLFTNDIGLAKNFIKAGKQVHQQSWHMPLQDYHRDLVKHKYADITNSSGKSEAGATQAAAFLENFVQKGTKWIHLDIGGTSQTSAGEGSGYGAALLLQYARNFSE